MDELSFGARLWLALSLPWRLMFNSVLAARVKKALESEVLEQPKQLDAPKTDDAAGTKPKLGLQEIAPVIDSKVEVAAPLIAEIVAEPVKEIVAEPVAKVSEKIEEIVAPKAISNVSAMQILAILQREGRLIDFLQEDVGSAADADVGAAARVVHAGCKKALAEYVTIEPLRNETEGDAVTIEAGFDPRSVLLVGNVRGEAPFHGTLTHPGWKVTRMDLPTLGEGQDPAVVAAAEVEI